MLVTVSDSVTSFSSRLRRRFTTLKAENKGGLAVYVTASDPDLSTSLTILKALPRAGASFIELGIPFSDPMADGPVIQAATQRALRVGGSLALTLEMVRIFRVEDMETPLVLMGYYNPIYTYGLKRFAAAAAVSGVDGCIVVDLPPEEADELAELLRFEGIDFIFLATPTTDYKRLPIVLRKASGFIYYVSIAGITGTTSAISQTIARAVLNLRNWTELPIAVGFGFNTPEQIAAIVKVADAVVVGSAVIRHIAANLDVNGKPKPALVNEVLTFVSTLAKFCDGQSV